MSECYDNHGRSRSSSSSGNFSSLEDSGCSLDDYEQQPRVASGAGSPQDYEPGRSVRIYERKWGEFAVYYAAGSAAPGRLDRSVDALQRFHRTFFLGTFARSLALSRTGSVPEMMIIRLCRINLGIVAAKVGLLLFFSPPSSSLLLFYLSSFVSLICSTYFCCCCGGGGTDGGVLIWD